MTELAAASEQLVQNWTFQEGSPVEWLPKARRRIWLRRAIHFPSHKVVKAAVDRPSLWIVYFIYALDGCISEDHHFSLARFRDDGFSILVVATGIPASELTWRLGGIADVIVWKAQPGYDFSAYTLGLRYLAKHVPGCDVLVVNDSVLGPFTSLRDLLSSAPWRLTGLTASRDFEPHVQSYTFQIKALDASVLRRLFFIFNPFLAFSRFYDVVYCQETRMARVASYAMSVGALWYANSHERRDCTLDWPFELIDDGFPFVKKALLGKSKDRQPRDAVADLLSTLGYRR